MGCNISNSVAVAQLSSEELQNNQEAKNQTKSDSSTGTEVVPLQDGAARSMGTSKDGDKLADETTEANSSEELPERFTSSQKRRNAQSTDALLTCEVISKSRPLQETERQKSSDILEELRMQGIIESQRITVRTGEVHENKRGALEKTLKKPPARLEKIQFGNKEVGDFTVKDTKTSAEAKKQVSRRYRQPPPFDGEPGVLLKEIAAIEATNNYTEDSVIESDNLELHQIKQSGSKLSCKNEEQLFSLQLSFWGHK
ncbi:stathmin domain-containing protein 1 [Pluvialis apricaria]